MSMDLQITEAGTLHDRLGKAGDAPDLEKYEGAMAFSAAGDALGWPTEFIRSSAQRNLPFELPVKRYVAWEKRVGGKWWGYIDKIGPGEYSDDTQLTLAVARSISETGDFEPERFAYEELPLWLQYERGGGSSIKTAARSLIRRNSDWLHNFYKQKYADYRNAGANGAAMRNLPIALVCVNDEAALVRDSFINAIITHGHPRAILGTILLALSVRHVLTDKTGEPRSTLLSYLEDTVPSVDEFVSEDNQVNQWVQSWNAEAGSGKSFADLFSSVRKEADIYLTAIPAFLHRTPEKYYRFIGALSRETKGSGLSTVCAALYLYLKKGQEPEKALLTAVNLYGSDSDTIAVFLGSLLGAEHGIEAMPKDLLEGIQDKEYLLKTARRLCEIAGDRVAQRSDYEELAHEKSSSRDDAYFRILAWEISFHDMFWDDLIEGDLITHPTLGRGKIVEKSRQEIPNREDYVAKLIRVAFDCGQTCVFHSRVKNDVEVLESLEKALRKALEEDVPQKLNIYRVTPKGDGWIVKDEDSGKTLSTHRRKTEAETQARTIAESQSVSEVNVDYQDGTFQRKFTCGKDRLSLFD